MDLIKWSPFQTGTYNEIVIPDLIDALDQEGEHDKAAYLRDQWEKKVKSFINGHPYLYGSEYPYDTTGFESTAALAKYAMARVQAPGAPPKAHTLPGQAAFASQVMYADAKTFLDGQFALNVASRGWLETAYYDMGSDYRGNGNISYTLSYMSQMAGGGSSTTPTISHPIQRSIFASATVLSQFLRSHQLGHSRVELRLLVPRQGQRWRREWRLRASTLGTRLVGQ